MTANEKRIETVMSFITKCYVLDGAELDFNESLRMFDMFEEVVPCIPVPKLQFLSNSIKLMDTDTAGVRKQIKLYLFDEVGKVIELMPNLGYTW